MGMNKNRFTIIILYNFIIAIIIFFLLNCNVTILRFIETRFDILDHKLQCAFMSKIKLPFLFEWHAVQI